MSLKAGILVLIFLSVIASEAKQSPGDDVIAKHDVIASAAKQSPAGTVIARSGATKHSKNVTDVTFLRSQPRVQNSNVTTTNYESPRNDKIKINTKERSLNNWQLQRQLEALINKSPNDLRLDALIAKYAGAKFKRASAYDLYPLEIYDAKLGKLDEAKRTEFIDYYDYARRELISASQGAQLRYLYHDYDLDGNGDYAVVIARPIEYDKKGLALKAKHQERIYLLIANNDQALYFQALNADYLEIINGGIYPTSFAIGRRIIKIPSPCFRVIALDGESYVIYYDRSKSAWLKVYTDEDRDGG